MKVLAINCGSSTLRFEVIDVQSAQTPIGDERRLATGIIDRIGSEAHLKFSGPPGNDLQETASVYDHAEAMYRVLGWLRSYGFLDSGQIQAIGHRVVHGGDVLVEPTLINDVVIAAIEALRHLAPLHNEPSLKAIRAARATLGTAMPMVVVFDTAFHCTMAAWASQYAIPLELAAKHSIRRYGFHGLAHRYMTERYAAITFTPPERSKLVTLQLGNGCSATAVMGGRSVDTSMGFTPLEGLMMGTRCGDIDASVPGFLARREGVTVDEIEKWLNSESGLLGVSGSSRDMRDVLEAQHAGDARASLAVEMFCHRVRRYVGAYLAVLGGADAIVFGGGIGEKAPSIRARICGGMDWCGLLLDQERNEAAVGRERRISTDNARIHAYVIPVNEAAVIARDTFMCLHRNGR